MQFLKTISLNLVLILILALGTATANTAPEAPGRLEVTGQAVIITAPDTARIILGVETTSTSVNAAPGQCRTYGDGAGGPEGPRYS